MTFDRRLAVVRSLRDSVALASREQLQELVSLVIERVDNADQKVVGLTWTPPTRPFVRDASVNVGEDGAAVWRPRTGPEIQERRSDGLGCYAEASRIGRERDSASAQARSDARTLRLDEHARGSRRRWSSWIARWAQNPVQ